MLVREGIGERVRFREVRQPRGRGVLMLRLEAKDVSLIREAGSDACGVEEYSECA
jgi:hypothetical protein